jgi:RsiW-degrading membrane proteinase PrsW (M82 family)
VTLQGSLSPVPIESAEPAGERRLALIGGACIAVSVAALLARLVGLMPSSAATLVVVAATGVGLRVALVFFARSGASLHRARVMKNVSTIGLGIAAVTIVAALPVTTHAGGFGAFSSSLFAQLWTLGILTVLASPVRTLGWRAFVGAGFTGFLALAALARVMGRPVVSAHGANSVFATSVWVPSTETLCQALPVLLLLLVAVRAKGTRPSPLDLLVIGAWSGAGFALYEDTQFGRGGVHWSAGPPFSLLFPSEDHVHSHASMLVAGHTVWMALLGLGLGFGVLYRRRFRRAWLAIPVALVVVVVEHGAGNALGTTNTHGSSPLVEKLLVYLTLGGWLSSILLVAGAVSVLVIERKALVPSSKPAEWWPLAQSLAHTRSQQLARAQAPLAQGRMQ